MRIVRLGDGTSRVAAVEDGPTVEVLVGEGAADGSNFGAAHVLVPPGGVMPEHDHGDSEALVVPQSGQIVIEGRGEEEEIRPGEMVLIGVGELVSLRNPSPSEPVALLAFFTPPQFVETLSSWPDAGESS